MNIRYPIYEGVYRILTIVIGNTNSWHKDSGLHQEKMIQFYPFTVLKSRI